MPSKYSNVWGFFARFLLNKAVLGKYDPLQLPWLRFQEKKLPIRVDQPCFSLPLGTALLFPKRNHNDACKTQTFQPTGFVAVMHTITVPDLSLIALSSWASLLFPVEFFVPMCHSTRRIVNHGPILTLGQDSNFSPTKFLAAWDQSKPVRQYCDKIIPTRSRVEYRKRMQMMQALKSLKIFTGQSQITIANTCVSIEQINRIILYCTQLQVETGWGS